MEQIDCVPSPRCLLRPIENKNKKTPAFFRIRAKKFRSKNKQKLILKLVSTKVCSIMIWFLVDFFFGNQHKMIAKLLPNYRVMLNHCQRKQFKRIFAPLSPEKGGVYGWKKASHLTWMAPFCFLICELFIIISSFVKVSANDLLLSDCN